MSHKPVEPTTTQIDKLFLELSQFSSAKTSRELALEARCDQYREMLDKLIKAGSPKQRRRIIREIKLLEVFL